MMNITISRLKELINEELGAFNEEQEELEEGSGDRNDPDREQGHGPQRQRAASDGGDGEYLEEGEDDATSKLSKRYGVKIKKPEKAPSWPEALSEEGALEEAGRMMADKQRGGEDPTRLRLEEYVAAMVDRDMGFEVVEEAVEPTLSEQIASIVDNYMSVVLKEKKKEGLGIQGLGKAETQASADAATKKAMKPEKKKITPLGDTNEAMKDGLERSLEETEESALEVNETLAGWYNKTLFESLTKKWSK
jgi:uncharacterized protein YggL (DUF469 family)